MLVCEHLSRPNDPLQVALHEVSDDVDVIELLGVGRHCHYVENRYYVFMRVEVSE